jgi:hypothetical protein
MGHAQPDTRLEATRAIKNLFDKFPHMRALGGDVTGRHACGNAAGGKGTMKVIRNQALAWTRMTQSESGNCTLPVKAPCRFSPAPAKPHIEKQTQFMIH